MVVLVLRIKELRISKKLSITRLAKLSGVSRGYLTELEQIKYDNPSLTVICALCKVLECTPNDLIPRELYTKEERGNDREGI